jgi:hypothetical protein
VAVQGSLVAEPRHERVKDASARMMTCAASASAARITCRTAVSDAQRAPAYKRALRRSEPFNPLVSPKVQLIADASSDKLDDATEVVSGTLLIGSPQDRPLTVRPSTL